MRRIAITLSLLVFALCVNAQSRYDTKEKVENRLKAILAYYVAPYFGPTNYTKESNPTMASSIVELKKCMKDSKNAKLLEKFKEIEKLSAKASDKQELQQMFYGYVDKYVAGKYIPETDKDLAKEAISRVIEGSDFPFSDAEKKQSKSSEKEKKDGDDEDDGKEISLTHTTQIPENQDADNEQQSPVTNGKGNHDDGTREPLLYVLLLFAVVVATFLGYKLYRTAMVKNKYEKILLDIVAVFSSKEVKKDYESLSKKVSILKKERDEDHLKNKDLERQLTEKENSIKDLTEKLEHVSHVSPKNVRNNSDGVTYNEDHHEILWTQQESDQTRTEGYQPQQELHATVRDSYEKEERDSVIGKEVFLSIPADNVFGNVFPEYRKGKVLYKMVYTSDYTAEYEYINKPETLDYARRSRSEFLEVACIIDNDNVSSFSFIQTFEKGKLEKTDEGWRIVSKARVHLV